jgi:SAM-dependent methyltransferase
MAITLIPKVVRSLEIEKYDRVTRTPLQKIAEEYLSEERAREQTEQIRRYCSLSAGVKLLELGSGYGTFVAYCRTHGICNAFGLEPGVEPFSLTYAISQELLSGLGFDPFMIKRGFAEEIPYGDAEFDVVFSTNVLEHTRDPARVLSETIRVLKPGGTSVCVVPNFGSWWEGHYGIFMPPHCPRWLLKAIVRVLSRDPSYIDSLQFVTHGKLKDWLKPFRDHVEVLTFGQDLWEERMRTLLFSDWAALGSIRTVLRWIHRLRLIGPAIAVGKWLHWESPLVLVLRRSTIGRNIPS